MTFHLVSLALFVVALPLQLLLGFWLANVLRMRDYGWRLALILCSIGIGGVFLYSLPLRLGVDLKGGVILVY